MSRLRHLVPLCVRLLGWGTLCAALSASFTCHADSGSKKSFHFGVVSHNAENGPDHSALREDLAAFDDDKLAFVVVNGIKAKDEDCSDDLYHDRLKLMDNAKNGLIVSLTADDWTGCLNAKGRSAAVGRLNLVRELFFSDKFSLGGSRLPVVRQSISPQFRSYSENTRWLFRDVLFATINLPKNNNNYLAEAGRNSEFEDRQIANEDWLQKTFTFAKRRKLDGIVLFCDGNPLRIPSSEELGRFKARRDGFAEVRRQIVNLAADYPGRVLILHRQTEEKEASRRAIAWNRNLGHMGLDSGRAKLSVSTAKPVFTLVPDSQAASNAP